MPGICYRSQDAFPVLAENQVVYNLQIWIIPAYTDMIQFRAGAEMPGVDPLHIAPNVDGPKVSQEPERIFIDIIVTIWNDKVLQCLRKIECAKTNASKSVSHSIRIDIFWKTKVLSSSDSTPFHAGSPVPVIQAVRPPTHLE